MVCKDCETKLGRVAAPDTWKAGARNTMESGGRRLGENKLLSVKKAGLQKTSRKCKECGQPCHQEQATLCHVCAYSKGVCAICGIQILDTSSYKMTGGSMVYHKVRGQEDASTAGPDQEEGQQREVAGEKRKEKVRGGPTQGVPKKRRKSDSWVIDRATQYYYHKQTRYYYDPDTGLYFHRRTGRWETKEAAATTATAGGVVK